MGGYVVVYDRCFACGRTFGFNPHRVPSVPILNGEVNEAGERRPICRDCATVANRVREAKGLPLFDTSDVCYDAIPEGEL